MYLKHPKSLDSLFINLTLEAEENPKISWKTVSLRWALPNVQTTMSVKITAQTKNTR
jgi:hypothetical protein